MKLITRKSEIKDLVESCISSYHTDGLDACISRLYELILSQKVKFPLLEFCAEQFYLEFPSTLHLTFLDEVHALKTEGGNVILGFLLQKRLQEDYQTTIDKAVEYIAQADIWYVCDIIGERVFGYALLHMPEKSLIQYKVLSQHSTNWVIRSLGAGAHYAIKKGLSKNHAVLVFRLLLNMANTKDKEIRQGVGWAAKTTAKFHPSIVAHFQEEIQNTQQVANWFRTKISIGLKRHQHAQRN